MSARLERLQIIPRPLEEVFAFFSDAANLQALTPEFLDFKILTPLPIRMRSGALIEYRIRLAGVPLSWHTRIEEFVPGSHFVDVQLSGPYRTWIHRHEFTRLSDGRTQMRDTVTYDVGFGPLGWLARALFVRRALDAIFDYRAEKVAERFPARSEADVSLPR